VENSGFCDVFCPFSYMIAGFSTLEITQSLPVMQISEPLFARKRVFSSFNQRFYPNNEIFLQPFAGRFRIKPSQKVTIPAPNLTLVCVLFKCPSGGSEGQTIITFPIIRLITPGIWAPCALLGTGQAAFRKNPLRTLLSCL
jgi:hypothetical protein